MKYVEKLSKRNRIFKGVAVNFNADEVVLPDGKKATREYLDHPGAVAVIPFIDDDHIVLVRQYRFPVGALTWELPAGKLDAGESPAACVRRELAEETGYAAKSVKLLTSYWPTSAFSNEVIHIYVARGLSPSSSSPDEDEFITHAVMPFDKVLDRVLKGRIRDSKTALGILFWATLRARKRAQRKRQEHG